MDVPMTFTWRDKDADDMSREELYECILTLIRERDQARHEAMYAKAGRMRDLASILATHRFPSTTTPRSG